MELESTAPNDYERIGRFIYAFHRLANPDGLRALPASGRLAPQLAGEGAALAHRFDAALDRFAEMDDEALAAILEDVRRFVKASGWTHEAAA